MADLSSIERRQLEQLLPMGSGYVLDFSHRTFSEFFDEHRDIDAAVYRERGTSKANRLCGSWAVEGNHLAGNVIQVLILYGPAERWLGDEPGLTELTDERHWNSGRREARKEQTAQANGDVHPRRRLEHCFCPSGTVSATARRLAAFDSTCVRVHLDDRNAFQVMPYLFDVFPRMVAAFGKLQVKLRDEIAWRTPAANKFAIQHSTSEVATALAALTAQTNLVRLKEQAVFGDAEAAGLLAIEQQLVGLRTPTRRKSSRRMSRASLT